MTDDPYRCRCPKCFSWMSKDREHDPGICYLCQSSTSGRWQPAPIAAHRYRPTTTRTSEAMVLEQEDR